MTLRLTATRAGLRLRARLLTATRDFFAQRNVLEVDTPALSLAGTTDPALSSVTARIKSLGHQNYYLHTSPEYAMKRLLVAGSGDIYQLCRVFRDDEIGRWHQAEFTMLEWYRVGWSELELIDEVEALLRHLLSPYLNLAGALRLSYDEAFEVFLGCNAHVAAPTLRARLEARGETPPAGLDADALRDFALSCVIVPALDQDAPVFIRNYPASQAALARIKPTMPPTAARFEAFLGGVELANGFYELCDADEQLARFEAENAVRLERGLAAIPIDREFIGALRQGLPDCAGVALGFDRVVALAAKADSLDGAVPFVHERDRV